MIAFDYLDKGLCGLARSHKAGTMAGHLGAAVLAGYFYGEDNFGLPNEVTRGVEGELERIIAGEEAIWYNARKVGLSPTELFEPYPQQAATPEKIPEIAAALKPTLIELKQSGHNVIFASIAIRALHDHPDQARPILVADICRLISAFQNTNHGRGFYGSEIGWKYGHEVELPADSGIPAYTSLEQMIVTTLKQVINTAHIHRQGFGGLWHLVNHAAAIIELDRYGYSELARLAMPGHHRHVRLLETLPDVEALYGPAIKATHAPHEPVYWEGMLKRDEARLTHRIKTMYGYGVLKGSIEHPELIATTDEAFLYLMD